MGNPLMRVSRGMELEFSADWYNLVCQTVEAFLGSRGGKVGGASMESQATFERVWIRNDSDSNRDKFDILGIDDGFANYAAEASEEEPDEEVLADQLADFRDQPVLIGVTPNEEDHTGRFVILQEAIAIGEIGLALVAGASLVQVDVSDEEHDHADVYDSEPTKLKSGSSGLVRIISKPSGTGVKWALVAYGGGDCDCPEHWYQIFFPGGTAPSAGAFELDLDVTISGSTTTYTASIAFDELAVGATSVKSKLEALGPFASDPDNYKVGVNGVRLPRNVIGVIFEVPTGVTLTLSRNATNTTGQVALCRIMDKPQVPDV